MAEMYKIKPYASDAEVKPNFDFYRIEPVHQSTLISEQPSNEKSNDQVDKKERARKTTPTSLKAKEEKLIEALKNFNLKLDKYMDKHGGKASDAGQAENQQSKKTKEPQQKTNEKPAKADNKKAESKKEDKKSKQEKPKQEKPKQEKSKQEKPKQEKPVAAKSGKPSSQQSLTVPEIKSTASVSYRGLDCVVDPFGYKTVQLPAKFQVQLHCQPKDKRWVETLAKLGQKRGIQIGESISGERVIKVKYSNDDRITLESAIFDTPLHGRVTIWKAIGTLLGLFDHSDAVLSAPTHQWLCVAENLLLGEETNEDVVRKLCNRLSANDFVAVYDIPSLSDYVLHSLIADIDYFPNNVELWMKRLR